MSRLMRIRDASNLAEFPVLLERVRETFILGQQRADEIKVQTYWEGGRLIHEHLKFHEAEAGYGKQCIVKLARGLDVGDDLLYRMLRFYEAFPISASRRKLSWSHYRTLARIPDQKRRLQLEARAERENWNSEKLEKHISFVNTASVATSKETSTRPISLLEPKRGKPGICRIVADGGGCAVDLGFTSYQALNPDPCGNRREAHSSSAKKSQSLVTSTATSFKAGDLVTLLPAGQPKLASQATAADLYTYNAELIRVVDGDTVWLKIWLKPGLWLKEKLRLRGLDCPEMDTPEGKAAKKFVEGLMNEAASITITTTKPDKWDRYLSDIFLAPANGEELFLNNELLRCGHARRTDKVALTDWEE
jgi:endonuclease YncB( thermonuclease family)